MKRRINQREKKKDHIFLPFFFNSRERDDQSLLQIS